MDLLRDICKEPCFKALGIKEWSSLDLVKRVADLLEGKAFVVYLEKMQGERVEVIVRVGDDLRMVWKAICSAFGKKRVGVNCRGLKKRFELVYEGRVFEERMTVGSLGIEERSVIKFLRKLKKLREYG